MYSSMTKTLYQYKLAMYRMSPHFNLDSLQQAILHVSSDLLRHAMVATATTTLVALGSVITSTALARPPHVHGDSTNSHRQDE
jgi:hypothetical protein